jgi:hypothetical protein
VSPPPENQRETLGQLSPAAPDWMLSSDFQSEGPGFDPQAAHQREHPSRPWVCADLSLVQARSPGTLQRRGAPPSAIFCSSGRPRAGQDRLSLIAYTPMATVVLQSASSHAVVAGFDQEGLGPFSEPLTITTTARTPNPDPEPPPLCAPGRIPPPRNLRASVSALVATIEWEAPVAECVIGTNCEAG